MSAEAPKPDTDAELLAVVIGKNAHRLRTNAELTLDQVSVAAQIRGLKWSESRVADFEAGRGVAPNLTTLIAVVLALQDAGCAEATFLELLRSEAPIQINDSLLMSDKQLVNLIFRWPVTGQWSPETMTAAIKASWEHFEASVLPTLLTTPPGATEERTWKALGISGTKLTELSRTLWNRTFPEERDRRAGAGANAQKRGQISRQMRKELQAAIEAATHGDDQ
jgi:transcriptional regulator with XRE-family HTH domain